MVTRVSSRVEWGRTRERIYTTHNTAPQSHTRLHITCYEILEKISAGRKYSGTDPYTITYHTRETTRPTNTPMQY